MESNSKEHSIQALGSEKRVRIFIKLIASENIDYGLKWGKFKIPKANSTFIDKHGDNIIATTIYAKYSNKTSISKEEIKDLLKDPDVKGSILVILALEQECTLQDNAYEYCMQNRIILKGVTKYGSEISRGIAFINEKYVNTRIKEILEVPIAKLCIKPLIMLTEEGKHPITGKKEKKSTSLYIDSDRYKHSTESKVRIGGYDHIAFSGGGYTSYCWKEFEYNICDMLKQICNDRENRDYMIRTPSFKVNKTKKIDKIERINENEKEREKGKKKKGSNPDTVIEYGDKKVIIDAKCYDKTMIKKDQIEKAVGDAKARRTNHVIIVMQEISVLEDDAYEYSQENEVILIKLFKGESNPTYFTGENIQVLKETLYRVFNNLYFPITYFNLDINALRLYLNYYKNTQISNYNHQESKDKHEARYFKDL